MLQSWWRKAAKALHEVRDRVSRRWEALERKELGRELRSQSSGSFVTANPMAMGASLGRSMKIGRRGSYMGAGDLGLPPFQLGLEERSSLASIDEPVRLRFIEGELRARRYRLLPRIAMWEWEVKQWRSGFEEIQEAKTAYRVMGHEMKLSDPESSTKAIFRWPPVRPSYLPRSHTIACRRDKEEARGACQCLGRQGDEEILAMWRRARRDPHGWTEIPHVHSNTRFNEKSYDKEQQETKGASTDSTAEPNPLLGEAKVTDQELTQWGVDPRPTVTGPSIHDSPLFGEDGT
jgi:hypothetical protein